MTVLNFIKNAWTVFEKFSLKGQEKKLHEWWKIVQVVEMVEKVSQSCAGRGLEDPMYEDTYYWEDLA